MNFEKIINYFRRLGKVFREKFAGLNFKKRDKSLKVRKAGIRSKWNRKQAEKSPEDRVTVLDMADVFLKTLKLLSDFFYVVIIVLTLFGAGLGLGYLGSQIQSVPLIKDKTLLNQIGEVSLVSSMSYSDSKKIADIDTDLLRTPIESDAISNNVKNAIIATEDENFNKHKGVVPKAVFRALVSSVLGVGSSSGGSTLTQQLIKQQVTGDTPTFKRKAAEIIYALQLERHASKNEILTECFSFWS